MDEKNISSEEKLLKLIRKEDKQKNKRSLKNDNEPSQSLEVDGQPKDTIVSLLRFLSRVFVVAIVLLIGFTFNKYLKTDRDKLPEVNLSSNDGTNVLADKVSLKAFTTTKNYEATISKRDIFEAPWEKEKSEGGKSVQNNRRTQPELKTLIRISGIVLDQYNPQAIVEDLQSGITLFLSKGNMIKGAKLVDILEDKAVFQYDNQRVELKP